ncbi:hypothetical protein ACWC2K_04055 [Streptomyces chattanoogensis]
MANSEGLKMSRLNPLRIEHEPDPVDLAVTQLAEELARRGVSVDIRPIVGDSQPDLVMNSPEATVAINIDLGKDALHFGSVVRIQDAVESLGEKPDSDPEKVSGVIVTNQTADGEIKVLVDRLNIRSMAMPANSERGFGQLADELRGLISGQ